MGRGFFIKFESKGPNTAEVQRQADNVVNFEREKLDGIVIQNGDDKIELRDRTRKMADRSAVQGSGGQWRDRESVATWRLAER